MRLTLTSSLILLLLAAAHAGAQQAPQPQITAASISPQQPQPPTFQAGAEEVVLDVVVRDKKGKPIKDLQASDIKVMDNGVEQKILGFRLVDGREAIQNGTKVPLDAMRQIRLVTLVFERLGDSARRIAKDAALDLIKGEQAQNVYFAVVAIDTQLFVLQEFTTNRDELKKAVAKATSGQYSTYAAESDRIKTSLRETAGRAGEPGGPRATPATPQAAGEAAAADFIERRTAEIMLEMLRFDSSFSREEGTRMSIFSLLSLVRGQYSLPGRKSIIYFSEGMWIPTHLDEPFRSISSEANRGNVTFYPVDTRGVMTWSQNQSAADELRNAARQTASDTTSTEGRVSKEQIMASDRAESSMRNNVQLPLRTLAESTGGFLIGDSNDLRGPLKQVNEEVSSYYEVTYNPGIQSYDGSFRKTEVSVSRKDVVLQARNGYFALPLNVRGPAMLPYEVALLKAIETTPAPADLEFRSAAYHLKPGPQGIRSLVIVELPMRNVKFTEHKEDNSFSARVSLVALLKDEKGEVVNKLSRDLPLKGALAQVPQIQAGNFIYKEPVMMPPGKFTLETAVVDHEAGKIGVLKTPYLTQPHNSGVGISNLCLVRNYEPNAKNLDPDEPLQFQGGKITPTLSGQVFAVKGAQLSTFFIVYPDPAIKDKPVAQVEFLVDGNVIANSEMPLPAADSQGRIPYVMSVPAENMPSATYEIRITAKQGSSTAQEKTQVTVAARQP